MKPVKLSVSAQAHDHEYQIAYASSLFLFLQLLLQQQIQLPLGQLPQLPTHLLLRQSQKWSPVIVPPLLLLLAL